MCSLEVPHSAHSPKPLHEKIPATYPNITHTEVHAKGQKDIHQRASWVGQGHCEKVSKPTTRLLEKHPEGVQQGASKKSFTRIPLRLSHPPASVFPRLLRELPHPSTIFLPTVCFHLEAQKWPTKIRCWATLPSLSSSLASVRSMSLSASTTILMMIKLCMSLISSQRVTLFPFQG